MRIATLIIVFLALIIDIVLTRMHIIPRPVGQVVGFSLMIGYIVLRIVYRKHTYKRRF